MIIEIKITNLNEIFSPNINLILFIPCIFMSMLVFHMNFCSLLLSLWHKHHSEFFSIINIVIWHFFRTLLDSHSIFCNSVLCNSSSRFSSAEKHSFISFKQLFSKVPHSLVQEFWLFSWMLVLMSWFENPTESEPLEHFPQMRASGFL